MKKKFVVDGYNVLHKLSELNALKKKDFASARDRFVRMLDDFASYTDVDVVVAFDGKPADRQIRQPGSCVEIMFADKGHSADEVIERLIFREKNKDNVTVVTDDSCESNMVRGMGCGCISVGQFEEIVKDALKAKDKEISKKNLINDSFFRGVKLDL